MNQIRQLFTKGHTHVQKYFIMDSATQGKRIN